MQQRWRRARGRLAHGRGAAEVGVLIRRPGLPHLPGGGLGTRVPGRSRSCQCAPDVVQPPPAHTARSLHPCDSHTCRTGRPPAPNPRPPTCPPPLARARLRRPQDDDPSALEAPCRCAGTQRYAHPACIQRWVDEKGARRGPAALGAPTGREPSRRLAGGLAQRPAGRCGACDWFARTPFARLRPRPSRARAPSMPPPQAR
jgi:hypothetical protein